MTTLLPGQGLSHALSTHAIALQTHRIPEQVIHAAKRLLLDTVAVAWAGSDASGTSGLDKAVNPIGQAGGVCDLLGRPGHRAQPQDAAFLNSVSAAALDYDAVHLEALVHAPLTSLPACLAVAQSLRLDGASFLTALVLADDVTTRLALSTRQHRGWFYTSLHGGLGATLGVARLMGLSIEETANALGIAYCQASGTQQSMIEKSLTKRLMAGFAARAAVFSCQLASAGVTGPHQILEGEAGLYRMYEAGDPSGVLQDLGETFLGSEPSFKKYPSCACAHAATEATLRLLAEHELIPSDIVEIAVTISPFMDRLVGGLYEPTPASAQVAAQFSVRYAVATCILRARFDTRDIALEAALSPDTIELAQRVKVRVDPAFEGRLAPVRVTLGLRSGQTLSALQTQFPGGPDSPLSMAELKTKAQVCLTAGPSGLTASQADRLIERIENIESWPNMATLLAKL